MTQTNKNKKHKQPPSTALLPNLTNRYTVSERPSTPNTVSGPQIHSSIPRHYPPILRKFGQMVQDVADNWCKEPARKTWHKLEIELRKGGVNQKDHAETVLNFLMNWVCHANWDTFEVCKTRKADQNVLIKHDELMAADGWQRARACYFNTLKILKTLGMVQSVRKREEGEQERTSIKLLTKQFLLSVGIKAKAIATRDKKIHQRDRQAHQEQVSKTNADKLFKAAKSQKRRQQQKQNTLNLPPPD